MKVYLAHPKLSQEFGARVTDFLEREGIQVFNPFRQVDQTKHIYNIMYDELDIISKIDALVGLITPDNTRAVHMEAFFAWEKGVPVILLWTALDNHYSWYEAFAKITFDTNEMLQALKDLSK